MKINANSLRDQFYLSLEVIESDDVRLISDEIEKAHNYKKKVNC